MRVVSMTPTIQRIQRLHFVLLAVVALVAAASARVSPWGVLLGGGVMGANLWLLQRLSQHLLSPGREQRVGRVVALGLAKQVLLLFLLAALFWRVNVDAVGFAVGVTLLVVACVAAALRAQPSVA